MYEAADAIEAAVEKTLDAKDIGGFEIRTADLGGCAKTSEMGDAVCAALTHILNSRASIISQ